METIFYISTCSSVFGEKTGSEHGELNFEDEIQAIFEGVRANDASTVGQKHHTTAQSAILVVKEFVLNHGNLACVLSFSLVEHDFGELGFALFNESLN